MLKAFVVVTTIGVAALWPVSRAGAQHIHFGGGGGGGGVGVHFGDDDHHDHHDWHDDHWDHHDGHHDVWHGDHWDHHDHHSGWHDSDWLWVVPALGNRHRGTYYSDQGNYYYMPQNTGAYTAAKPIEIAFGGYAHIDDLSARLEYLANQLCLDLHYNYKNNPGYAETYRAAYLILNTAKYIRVKANQADRNEVARRLNELDGLFHQVEANLKSWSRRSNRQIGQGGAQNKLEMVGAMMHHLMQDVGVAGVHGAPLDAASPADSEIAPPPEAVPGPAQVN